MQMSSETMAETPRNRPPHFQGVRPSRGQVGFRRRRQQLDNEQADVPKCVPTGDQNGPRRRLRGPFSLCSQYRPEDLEGCRCDRPAAGTEVLDRLVWRRWDTSLPKGQRMTEFGRWVLELARGGRGRIASVRDHGAAD